MSWMNLKNMLSEKSQIPEITLYDSTDNTVQKRQIYRHRKISGCTAGNRLLACQWA